ncbi:hypothetical protein T492DRAFT_920031 [Pavlovales sp. CCMP2436]|nr:hypothetical protein T492DRAFT_920031 [Pavlovales sp. CCMP2436]
MGLSGGLFFFSVPVAPVRAPPRPGAAGGSALVRRRSDDFDEIEWRLLNSPRPPIDVLRANARPLPSPREPARSPHQLPAGGYAVQRVAPRTRVAPRARPKSAGIRARPHSASRAGRTVRVPDHSPYVQSSAPLPLPPQAARPRPHSSPGERTHTPHAPPPPPPPPPVAWGAHPVAVPPMPPASTMRALAQVGAAAGPPPPPPWQMPPAAVQVRSYELSRASGATWQVCYSA